MAWEGLSLSAKGTSWPSMSDMARALSRPVVGRWLFFALWLWFGWHYFIRGWTFPLRGSAPTGRSGAGTGPGKSAGQLFVQVVVPMLGAYAFAVGATFLGRRHRLAGRKRVPLRPGQVVLMMVGGWLALAGTMGLYQLAVGHEADGIAVSALTGGALLAFGVGAPVFLVLSVVERGLLHRRPTGAG